MAQKKSRQSDRHRGTFVGTWLNEEEMRMFESIQRKLALGSRSSTVKYMVTRVQAFLKDERG